MFSQYITRNGDIATIDGISEYYLFGENHVIYSGTVNDNIVAWNKHGRCKINEVVGLKNENHPNDLVDWMKE